MGRRWYADAGARRPARRLRHVVLEGDQAPRTSTAVLETRASSADARRAGGRLVRGSRSRQSHGPSSGRATATPAPAVARPSSPAPTTRPVSHVHDPVAYHAGRAEAERDADGRSRRGRRSRSRRTPRRRTRPPPPAAHAARRCTVRSSRRPCSPPASRRRPARRVARRSGAPTCRRGGREHRPRRRGAERHEAGMNMLRALCALVVVAAACGGPSRFCCGARSALGELQRRRLRRLVQVERHRLVVVQLRAAPRGRAAAARRPLTEDTSGATFTCTVNYGGSFVGSSVTVRKDSSPPDVTASASRGPGRERVVHEPGQLQLHG